MENSPNTETQIPSTLDQTCAVAWQALRSAHDRIARRLTGELGSHCGLTIGDFDVLLYLQQHHGVDIRMLDLTNAAMLSQPALSRLVGRLEERGLVARAPAADDGRAIIVRLTDDGRDLAARAIQVHARSVHDELTNRLTDQEQTTLRHTLSRLAEPDAT